METDDRGQPLTHYRDEHPGSAVRLFCSGRGCAKSRAVKLDDAIKVAGESAAVREVYRFARTTCECGLPWGESRPEFKKVR
jgi:hypothetical protein